MPVTLPQAGAAPVIDVFASDPARLQTHYDTTTDPAIYLLGHAAHPAVTGPSLLRRAAERHATADIDFPRSILGLFVLIIDDRRLGRVTFLGDAMGVRPWFVGGNKGGLVAGTDVLPLCAAGLSKGEADYDAIATWMLLNQPMAARPW